MTPCTKFMPLPSNGLCPFNEVVKETIAITKCPCVCIHHFLRDFSLLTKAAQCFLRASGAMIFVVSKIFIAILIMTKPAKIIKDQACISPLCVAEFTTFIFLDCHYSQYLSASGLWLLGSAIIMFRAFFAFLQS